MTPSQRLFLTILVLVSLALIATSKRLYRVRRSRPMSLLLSGGWFAIGAGILVGPGGIGAVDRDMLLNLTPLMMVGLGWIGMMVGLQARRSVLAQLPASMWRAALFDLAVSVVLFGALGWVLLDAWIRDVDGPDGLAWRLPGAALIAACAVGWAMETRSLRAGAGESEAHLALLVRAGGGLAAIFAILVFGLFTKIAVRAPESGEMTIDPSGVAIRLAISFTLALVVGLVGRYALSLAGRDRSSLLAVFLGLVTLLAGVAFTLGASALLTSMLTGVVIANLAGSPLRIFERFIFQAEQVVATLFAMFAGVLIDPAIGLWGLAIAAAIAAARLVAKPPLFRRAIGAPPRSSEAPSVADQARSASAARSFDVTTSLPVRSPLYAAPIRQGPLAIAMGVGLMLSEPSAMNGRLLAIIVLAGLISEALPLVLSFIDHARPRATSVPASATPGAAA